MRALAKVGLSLLVLAFILIGVSYSMLRAEGVQAGARTERRAIASDTRVLARGIDAVEVSGPINLVLRYGPVATLVVKGEERLLPNIETTQEGNVLRIGTRGMLLHHRLPLQAVLVLPNVTRLAVEGSGDSVVTGLSGDSIIVDMTGSGSLKFTGRYQHVTASLHGSGDLELNTGNSDEISLAQESSGHITAVGSARKLSIQMQGSGDIDARHLRADEVALKQSGSGDAIVLAQDSVAIETSGSGDVRVRGNPRTQSVARTGSGAVTFKD